MSCSRSVVGASHDSFPRPERFRWEGFVIAFFSAVCSVPNKNYRYYFTSRSGAVAKERKREQGAPMRAALVPRTRSSHHNCRESGCELRVQSGTRIIELLVSFDSEVRIGMCGKIGRTSESGH